MNQIVEAMIAFGRGEKRAKKQYKFGRHGPNKYDCVGFVLACVRAAGLDKMVYPLFWTVRNMVTWGENTGALHLGLDGIRRGDIALWGDASRPDHRPVSGAGHTLLVLQPPTAAKPRGKAISAYNEDKDIIVTELVPATGSHLAFFGYLRLPTPARDPVAPPPDEQPEPPAPSDEAGEVPDDPPTVEELQARIDVAVEALTK